MKKVNPPSYCKGCKFITPYYGDGIHITNHWCRKVSFYCFKVYKHCQVNEFREE